MKSFMPHKYEGTLRVSDEGKHFQHVHAHATVIQLYIRSLCKRRERRKFDGKTLKFTRRLFIKYTSVEIYAV